MKATLNVTQARTPLGYRAFFVDIESWAIDSTGLDLTTPLMKLRSSYWPFPLLAMRVKSHVHPDHTSERQADPNRPDHRRPTYPAGTHGRIYEFRIPASRS